LSYLAVTRLLPAVRQETAPLAWRDFVAPGFKADMPGKPKYTQQVQQVGADRLQVQTYEVSLRSPARSFGITYSDYPAHVIRATPAEARLNGARDGAVKAVRGRLRSEKRLTLNGFPGRELEIEVGGKGAAVTRLYAVDSRMFILTVGGPDVKPDDPDVKRFLDSFQLQSAGPPPNQVAGQPRPPVQPYQPNPIPMPVRPNQPQPAVPQPPEPPPPPYVPTPVQPVVIKPPALNGDKTVVPLAAPVTDVAVGGAGRYLILHMPNVRRLAVFDANEAKVVREIPVPELQVFFAAGMDKLIVALPQSRQLIRYSLATFQQDATAPLPLKSPCTGVALGSASNGPLLLESRNLGQPGERRFFDIVQMKQVDIAQMVQVGLPNGRVLPPIMARVRLHAAADGSVFTAGHQSFILLKGSGFNTYEVQADTDLLPGPDGRTLYSCGQMFTAQGKALGPNVSSHGHAVWYVPALHGPYYISLNEARAGEPATRTTARRPQVNARGLQFLSLSLHLVGDRRPLVTLPKLDALNGLVNWLSGAAQPLDQHVFLIPDAELLVILPLAKTQLILHRFNLTQLLETAGVDYLFVSSQPPTQFRPGTPLSYQMVVRSKKGGVRYKLESAPSSMTVSPAGLLRWEVPGNFQASEAEVTVTVADVTGQEILHTFKLTNGDHTEAAKGPAATAQPGSHPPAPVAKAPPRLPAPVNPLPITPTPLNEAKVSVTLPGQVGNLCVGGGGRFLILHLPQTHQLAVFDVNEAKVVKYLPITEERVLLAAGMEKLVVVLPDKNLILRWSLTTFQREVIAAVPLSGKVNAVCMGSASAGPLLLTVEGGPTAAFLDIMTMRLLDLPAERGQLPVGAFLRAAADGTVFGMRQGLGGEPHTVALIQLRGGRATARGTGMNSSVLTPSPEGRYIYTGWGVYNDQLQPLFPRPIPRSSGKAFVPATHGPFFMRLDYKQWDRPGGSLAFFITGQEQPFGQLGDVAGVSNEQIAYGTNRDRLTHDQRVHFIPAARLVVSIPATSDRLELHRFDPDEALEKSGMDYLVVTSSPRPVAVKGQSYVYPLVVKSRKGGVQYRLDSGPDGMKVGPDGRLTWDVPADFAEAEVDVILTVRDAAGQEMFHTFKITVTDKG
jgi:hypothetical protein